MKKHDNEENKPMMKIKDISVIVDGKKVVEINEEFQLFAGDSNSGGGAYFRMPPGPSALGEVTTRGSGYIKLVDGRNYSLADYDQKIETLSHWARLQVKDDYLDLLFGKKGEEPHPHAGFRFDGESVFQKLRRPTGVAGQSEYTQELGIIPVIREYTDKLTGVRVRITFVVDEEKSEVMISSFEIL